MQQMKYSEGSVKDQLYDQLLASLSDSLPEEDLFSEFLDPLSFVIAMWPDMVPTTQQRRVLEAFGAGNRKFSVKSGHGTGKTTLSAWLLLFFISTKPGAICPITKTL